MSSLMPHSLHTEMSIGAAEVVLRCRGSAESASLDALADALDQLHRKVVRSPSGAVVVDLIELGFATSSCLKEFVAWLLRVRELDDDQRYKVRFRSNARHSWQRRSLGALAACAPDVVEIETVVS